MATFELIENKIVISMDRDHSDDALVIIREINLSVFDISHLCRLMNAFTSLLNGMEAFNYRNANTFMFFIKFLNENKLGVPESKEAWTMVLLLFFRHNLVNQDSKASLESREQYWFNCYYTRFVGLQNLGIIPADVAIPKLNKTKTVSKATESENVVTATKIRESTEIKYDKCVCEIDPFADSDEYFNQIEENLRGTIEDLQSICLSHFHALRDNYHSFSKVGCEISDDVIEGYIAEGDWFYSNKKVGGSSKVHRLNADHEQGFQTWFALIRHLLARDNADKKCLSSEQLKELGIFPTNLIRTLKKLHTGVSAKSTFSPNVLSGQHYWSSILSHVGIMRQHDCYALAILIIIANPKFNPLSLLRAKVLDVNGKSYLLTGDKKGTAIFSVDKPRAGCRKYSVLDEISKEIVEFILKATAPLRRILKARNDRGYRYLFLTLSIHKGISFPFDKSISSTSLKGTNSNVSLAKLYSDNGYKYLNWDNNISLSSIRTTMGLLKWFETGSIDEMAETLGNKRSTTIAHYLPTQLLRLWNARIIRRFQNTLILLACHDEPWLSKVIDCNSENQLAKFIAQLLTEYDEGSSPVADLIHKKMGQPDKPNDNQCTNSEISAFMMLSPTALAIAYAYSEIYPDASHSSEIDNSIVFIATLGKQIRHLMANPTAVERVISDSPHQAISIHNSAIDMIPEWKCQIQKLSINKT